MKIEFNNDENKNLGYLKVDGRIYEMPVSVVDVLVLENRIIVLLGKGLTHLTRPHGNSNVICLDLDGKWLWEIEHREPLYEEARGGGSNRFVQISQIPGETRRFKARGGDFWVIVDAYTGKWLEYHFTK